MKQHTFTGDEFKEFSDRIYHWMNAFGITDWHVTIEHVQIGDRVAAQTQANPISKSVSFRLTQSIEGDYGFVTEVSQLALHEVLHLLLFDFCCATASLGDAYHDIVIGREHEVINKLMRVLK